MDKLDSVQLEQLQTIGAFLQQVRQEQSRTLEEIAAKTYIPLRILRALEAGRQDILPEPVFIQGFIRRYGDALGLDGTELSHRFSVQPAPMVSQELNSGGVIETIQPRMHTDEIETPKFADRPARNPVLPILAIAVAVVALGGMAYGIVNGLWQAGQSDSEIARTDPEPEPIASPETAPIVPPSPASTNSPAPSVVASPSPAASAPRPSPRDREAALTVDVSLTGESWMQVIVDGNVEYEGVLPRGTQRSWTGAQEVTVVAGNAGAVMVALNDQQAKTMGQAGDVAEQTFRATGSPPPQ